MKKKIDWYPMLRSNRRDLHPLWFGLYEDLIYHHGAGFRPPVSRADLAEVSARESGRLPRWVRKAIPKRFRGQPLAKIEKENSDCLGEGLCLYSYPTLCFMSTSGKAINPGKGMPPPPGLCREISPELFCRVRNRVRRIREASPIPIPSAPSFQDLSDPYADLSGGIGFSGEMPLFEKHLLQMRVFVNDPQDRPVRLEIFVNLRRDCLIGEVVQILNQYQDVAFSHFPECIQPGNFPEISDDFAILERGNEFAG